MSYTKLMSKLLIKNLRDDAITVFVIACFIALLFAIIHGVVFSVLFFKYIIYAFCFLLPWTLGTFILGNTKKILLHKKLAKEWEMTPQYIFLGLEEFQIAGASYIWKNKILLTNKNFPGEKRPMEYLTFLRCFSAEVVHREGWVGKLEIQTTGSWNGIELFKVIGDTV